MKILKEFLVQSLNSRILQAELRYIGYCELATLIIDIEDQIRIDAGRLPKRKNIFEIQRGFYELPLEQRTLAAKLVYRANQEACLVNKLCRQGV